MIEKGNINMFDNIRFWFAMMGSVAFMVFAVVVSGAVENAAITKMVVEAGASPMHAACAVRDMRSTSCIVLAAGKQP